MTGTEADGSVAVDVPSQLRLYWEATPQYTPTPGDFGRSPASSIYSPSSPVHQPQSDQLKFVQLSDWEERRHYDADSPMYLHYSVEYRTEPDLVLAPSAYWVKVLRQKLESRVKTKTQRSRRVRSEDTAVVVSVNDRPQRDLNKWFEKTSIKWSAVEQQIAKWSNLFRIDKKLNLSNDKRGTRSVTRKILADRDAQINAESTLGQVQAWGHVYRLMRCPGKPCDLGKYLKTHRLIDLVKYVRDEHCTLETHDDIPDGIREQLYAEEQQRSRSRVQKGLSVNTSTGYPININIQPPAKEKLKIRGPRDTAVRVYCEWQESNVVDENLKANFREARALAISNGYDLEQV
ncbi:uncharacterized protein BO97DRAFT_438055 [Aspergillus homomorphus CBS 101889]|uniref:Uncharacterized protein n=1 Tax=Aspergillus homomorphus (strain CBS 101889) TaxID=1450537 RepID=A0A395HJ53_ASPHC|nr:hypothetical protein BO97DRAFT_438055 [Aspergillus homomorphus CBS 101889]RAL07857.1 hypothetical protein BO97DRAFT_438055 [Aspergillus homomorphus CBS 101889]